MDHPFMIAQGCNIRREQQARERTVRKPGLGRTASMELEEDKETSVDPPQQGELVATLRRLGMPTHRPQSISNHAIALSVLPDGSMSLPREGVPKQLFRAGVSRGEWEEIWDSVAQSCQPEWAPVIPWTSTTGVDGHRDAAGGFTASTSLASFLLKPKGILVRPKMDCHFRQIGLEMTGRRATPRLATRARAHFPTRMLPFQRYTPTSST